MLELTHSKCYKVWIKIAQEWSWCPVEQTTQQIINI